MIITVQPFPSLHSYRCPINQFDGLQHSQPTVSLFITTEAGKKLSEFLNV